MVTLPYKTKKKMHSENAGSAVALNIDTFSIASFNMMCKKNKYMY